MLPFLSRGSHHFLPDGAGRCAEGSRFHCSSFARITQILILQDLGQQGEDLQGALVSMQAGTRDSGTSF